MMVRGAAKESYSISCSLARQRAASRIIVAPFSAIIAVGVLVLPDVMVGMIDASATRVP
jgi:hypothetical protein